MNKIAVTYFKSFLSNTNFTQSLVLKTIEKKQKHLTDTQKKRNKNETIDYEMWQYIIIKSSSCFSLSLFHFHFLFCHLSIWWMFFFSPLFNFLPTLTFAFLTETAWIFFPIHASYYFFFCADLYCFCCCCICYLLNTYAPSHTLLALNIVPRFCCYKLTNNASW